VAGAGVAWLCVGRLVRCAGRGLLVVWGIAGAAGGRACGRWVPYGGAVPGLERWRVPRGWGVACGWRVWRVSGGGRVLTETSESNE
jgi:hypothetical protein